MNYISEIKAFQEIVQDKSLSSGQIALWYGLMYVCNRSGWQEWFTVSSLSLQSNTGLSRQGINKNRNILKQLGLIDFRANGTNATKYKLCTIANSSQVSLQDNDTMSNSLQVGCQISSQNSSQVGCQISSQNSSTLNKLNINETKPNLKESTKESFDNAFDPQPYYDIFNNTCTKLKPVTVFSATRDKEVWRLSITYTIEQFKTACENIAGSNFLCGENKQGWKASFDWLIKQPNFVKVLEGNYDNSDNSKGSFSNSSFDVNSLESMGLFDVPEVSRYDD